MKWLLLLLLLFPVEAGRGGRGRGKGKGKNILPFGNVMEYSRVTQNQRHPKGAQILRGSYYNQVYRLGFKLLLICLASGDPRPDIKWYKDGAEVYPKFNTNLYQEKRGRQELWSKLEIDPGTMGDQGIFTCMTHNTHGLMAKNIKTEYTY